MSLFNEMKQNHPSVLFSLFFEGPATCPTEAGSMRSPTTRSSAGGRSEASAYYDAFLLDA